MSNKYPQNGSIVRIGRGNTLYLVIEAHCYDGTALVMSQASGKEYYVNPERLQVETDPTPESQAAARGWQG